MFKVAFNESPTFGATFDESNTHLNASFGEGVGSSAPTEHETLTGRDKPEQHPIAAITALDESLVEATGERITNQELEEMLK